MSTTIRSGAQARAGALLTFDVRKGIRPIPVVALATISGVGVSLAGILQGSNELRTSR